MNIIAVNASPRKNWNTAQLVKAADVEAISVENENSEITEKVDVLFVGGALYAYGIDEHLKSYLSALTHDKVSRAIVFSI